MKMHLNHTIRNIFTGLVTVLSVITCDLFAPADAIAPTVSIAFPANNTLATGLVVIGVNAEDNVGIVDLELRLDGEFLGVPTLQSTIYSFDWDSNQDGKIGYRSLVLTAADANGNKASDTLTVFVAGAHIRVVPNEYPTILMGLAAAAPGDTVLIDRGIYPESITFYGKKVVVGSRFLYEDDPSFIAKTVIDGQKIRSNLVKFRSRETSAAELNGVTIRNALSNSQSIAHGAGIYCDRASPTLRNLVIEHNSTGGNGGGIYLVGGSTAIIEDVVLRGNSASRGAGIYIQDSAPFLRHVTVDNNSGDAGVNIVRSSPSFQNVLIINNGKTSLSSSFAGGVSIDGNGTGPILFENVTIAFNFSDNGSGGIEYNSSGGIEIVNSIFWENAGGDISKFGADMMFDHSYIVRISNPDTLSPITDTLATWIGVIPYVPSIATLFADRENGNYHLRKPSNLTDRGNPSAIYNDADGTRNDMGAYGGPYGDW